LDQKKPNLPLLRRCPAQISNLKLPIKKNQNSKIFRIFRGFDQISSSTGSHVMTGESH